MKNQTGNEGITSALYIWNGMTAFWGTSFHTQPHSHNTLQLVFDIEKEFKIKDNSSDWNLFSAAIIRPFHVHQLDSNNSMQLFIYLDKDSEYAKKLNDKYLINQDIADLNESDLRDVNVDFFKKLLVNSDCSTLFQGLLNIIKHLIDFVPFAKKDERIIKAIKFIERTNGIVKVKRLAEHVFLSESRLRVLFKKEVGQSIQGFMLWVKVVNSVNPILKGEQLTKTAREAGFWDLSHMTRSFKELLAISPNSIKKYEKEEKVIVCDKVNFYMFKTEIFYDWNVSSQYRTVEI